MAGSTPHQRLHVRSLLLELELDMLHVTAELLPLAERAGLTTWHVGDRVDDVLRTATSDQARALAKVLIGAEVALV